MTNNPLDDTLTALAHGQMPYTRELGIGIVGGDATTIRAPVPTSFTVAI